MKAAVLYGMKDLRIEEIDNPTINEHEVLIRVKATGICGSDIPRVIGTAAHFYPNVLGHEFSGIIESVGSQVTHLTVGDFVAVAPLKPCHCCEACQSGQHALCQSYSFIGSREFGGWAEYVKAPAMNAVKLPKNVDFVQGAFIEPITVALHGLILMGFQPMKQVAITGMGTIGLLTLQCALLMGAKDITVFDINEERLKIAYELGATHCIHIGDPQLQEQVKAIHSGKGFEYVLETAGVPSAELLCLELAGAHGSIMYIGTPHESFTITPKQFEMMNRKELTLRGSWMSYSAPFPGKEWTLAAHYLGTGQIKVEPLIDRIILLEEIGQAFKAIENKTVSGKIIMTLDQ